MHDVVLQKLPMVIALDRAGIVPHDGVTHQGVFDIPLFSSLPDVQIYSPENFTELEQLLTAAVREYSGIRIIRYPMGADAPRREETDLGTLSYFGADHPELVAVTYGRLTSRVEQAARLCGRRVRVIKLGRVFPIDTAALEAALAGCDNLMVFEEGMRSGGVGEKLAATLRGKTVRIHAIDAYLPHGDLDSLYELAGFGVENMARELRELI